MRRLDLKSFGFPWCRERSTRGIRKSFFNSGRVYSSSYAGYAKGFTGRMTKWCGAWGNSHVSLQTLHSSGTAGPTLAQGRCVPSNPRGSRICKSPKCRRHDGTSWHFHTTAYALLSNLQWWAGCPDGAFVTSDTPFLMCLATARTVRMVVAA